MINDTYDFLEKRGYVYQLTQPEEIKIALNNGKTVFYLGIDPTADSLHIGHFFALMMFRKLQKAGLKGIVIIGGATALVGDPSGKTDMRKMLTKEEVEKNLDEVKMLIKKFVETDGENPAIILNNADWIGNKNYVDFLREVGVHFNMAKMLKADAYANRIKEGGLSFMEMGYMLMQAYDFVYLKEKYGCTLQIGGSDQWGNIIAGVELNRKLNFLDGTKQEIYGLTCPLLMTKDGKKMGKTEDGTLWVAREKTSVFNFYQYFFNVPDENTEMLLKLFTEIEQDEIDKVINEDIVKAKRLMSYEITKLVHGKEAADDAVETVKQLFGKKNCAINAPSYTMDSVDLEQGISALDVAVASGLIESYLHGKGIIAQGGFSINNKKVKDIDLKLTLDDVNEDGKILMQRGKKTFIQIIVRPNQSSTTR